MPGRLALSKPNEAKYHYYLGQALRFQTKYAGAEAAYKKALEIDPNYIKAQEELQKLSNKQKQ